MVGRQLAGEMAHDIEQKDFGAVALSVQDVCTQANPSDTSVSFNLKYGEIVGIAGLVGAGRTEILRGIFGIDAIRVRKFNGMARLPGFPAQAMP
jgi:ribose transport system ATP-binding protein